MDAPRDPNAPCGGTGKKGQKKQVPNSHAAMTPRETCRHLPTDAPRLPGFALLQTLARAMSPLSASLAVQLSNAMLWMLVNG